MEELGLPSLPDMLAMLTTRPQPRSFMPGTNTRSALTVPSTLTSRTWRHSSPVVSSSGLPGPTIPAELTRTSTGPVSAATRRSAASSVTSAVTSAPAPRSSVITVSPSARSRSAVAAPSPLAPPVTSAVLDVATGSPSVAPSHRHRASRAPECLPGPPPPQAPARPWAPRLALGSGGANSGGRGADDQFGWDGVDAALGVAADGGQQVLAGPPPDLLQPDVDGGQGRVGAEGHGGPVVEADQGHVVGDAAAQGAQAVGDAAGDLVAAAEDGVGGRGGGEQNPGCVATPALAPLA